MKRDIEITNLIADKMAEMSELKSSGKLNEAYEVLNTIKELQKELEIEKCINKSIVEDRVLKELNEGKGDPLAAFNKAVRGIALTEAENSLIEEVEEDGGVLVPIDQRTKIEELKRSLNSLKQYCKVMPVSTLSGSMPIEVDNNDRLINFDEMVEIAEGDIKFKKIDWKVSTKGLLIPLSNQLKADEKANLLPYISSHFAKRAVRTENKDIIDLMNTADVYNGTGYTDIFTILNIRLDPAISYNAKIFTNQSGFDYLDSLKDNNGRELLQPILTDSTKRAFRGREVVVINDSEYINGANEISFWIGDLNSYCYFMDRMTLEVAMSNEAGFKSYSTFLRAVERYTVVKADNKAGIKLVIPKTRALKTTTTKTNATKTDEAITTKTNATKTDDVTTK